MGIAEPDRIRSQPSTEVDLEERVLLPAPADVVWKRMLDTAFVIGCVPGLIPESVTEIGGGEYEGRLKMGALGVVAIWTLRARLQPDEAQRRLRLDLDGADKRLGMTLTGWAVVDIVDDEPAQPALAYTARVDVVGRMAARGAPIIRKVVEKIIAKFVTAIGEPDASDPAAEPRARTRVWARFVARLRAWLRRPRPTSSGGN